MNSKTECIEEEKTMNITKESGGKANEKYYEEKIHICKTAVNPVHPSCNRLPDDLR